MIEKEGFFVGKWLKMVLFLVASAFLTRWIPFSSFFRNVDTMIHEFGHALITLILSGQVMYIELYVDHSGITRSAVGKVWTMIPIALAGYMTASLFAWFLFSMYAQGKQRRGLTLLNLIAIVSLVLFVRNGFGITWLIGFIAINAVVLIWPGNTLSKYYYLLIAFLSLEESVFGPISLMLSAFVDPNEAGDAAVLSQDTFIPAAVWTIWFTIFSLWCAKQAIQAFTGRKKALKSPSIRL
jgi:hypothetical protein